MANKQDKEIVIIGAGPAGYSAAFKASDLGLNVTLIDDSPNPGGTCLFEGCIPVKTLLEQLRIKEIASKAEAMGLTYKEPEMDLEAIIKWKKTMVKDLTEGIGLMSKERNISYLRGIARFVAENEIEVQTHQGEEKIIRFEKAIIATGSFPKSLPEVDFDHEKVIDSTDALQLKEIPESILIVGGGFLSTELGSLYKALGAQVSVVEETAGMLSWLDQDLTRIFNKQNEEIFEEVFLETTVAKVQKGEKKVAVKLNSQEDQLEREYDLILIAIGRIPNTSNLNLDKIGLAMDESGFIKVDQDHKTNLNHIYAIGDIIGKPMYANKAYYDGQLVAEVIADEYKDGFLPKAFPAVISSTQSELAWCGLTEKEAKEKGIEIEVVKFPWSASGRAASIGIKEGLTKLILDPEGGKILGGGVVGEEAGSLIAEIAFGIDMSATAEDISLTIHPHPTLSETIMESAESLFGSATHFMGNNK